ncbi:unnamed protein product [Ixodes pacificus]
MAQPGDDRRGASRRSGEATRLGATGELASGPSTGSASGAAARTDRQGVSLSFAVHEAALQPEDDAELYYDLMLTDSSEEPSRSLEDAADWSQTTDSNSESKVTTKTIIRTSNDAQNQNSRLRHSMPVQQRRSLNSIYASSRGRRPSCVLEQEFEVSISEDDSQQVNEIEDLQEIEASDDFVSGVDEEVNEIVEKLFGPPVPLQGHRLRHYHVTETTGTPEAVAYVIAAAAEPRVTTKLVPTAKPVPISKFVTAASVFKTERTLPKTRAAVLTASPVVPCPIVPALRDPPVVPYPIVPVLRDPPAVLCPMAPVTPLSTYRIEEAMPKDGPVLTRMSVPITPLVTGTTAKRVRTAGSIYGPAGFSFGLSSRKVQYSRQPEVHEYTKESSGSGGGTRLEWKRQQDGVVLLDVGPPLTKEQEEAERRRSQMNPELEDEAMRIRIAVSTNNLRRNRPVAPSSTRPTQNGKRSVSTESISLIECRDPERQLLVNRVEVNRAHKVRVPTAQPEPTIFNEMDDSRVRVTALCKEHMSLRGMSVPSSRPSPSMGRSAVDHGLMGTTPGTYTDGKYYSQAVGSPERQGPNPTSSRKIRRHIMYAPQLKTGVPRDFLVYFLVSMATLASIFAAIGVFSKPDSGEHLDENPVQNSPGPISRGNPREPVVLRRNRRPPRTNNFGVCKSLECQREGVALASMLDWALDPCADFQAFACRSTRATPLQEMERHVGIQLQQRPLAAPLVHLQRLRRECLEVKGRSWNQLRGLLDSLALEGWPFSDSSNLSRDRVWEVAASLQRRLGITSLLAVSLQPGSEVLVRKAAPAWSRDEEDLMASRYHTFAGSLRGESAIDRSSQAAQVVQLARELSDLPSQSPTERAQFDDSPYKLFFASLFDVNDNRTRGQPAVLFSRQLAYRLTQLLGQAEPHVVLNYQGFLATLSVEPLLPDMNASETRCWRLVEDALPELFLYAAFRSRRSVMAALSNMTESVKRNVMLYVNSASWMEAGVRRESVERLRELRVHAFAPSWFWAADRVRVQFDMLSQVGSGQGIAAVAAFKEHAQNRLLRGDAWPLAPRDSHCVYDSWLRTLYLPLLAANLSGSLDEPLTLARLPRMGTHLAACLLHVVISGAGRWWGARTVRNLEPLRKCVAFQAPQGIDPDPLLERLAALAPVHSLYDELQRARGIRDSEYRLPHAENVTSKQLFFIYYGISQCHVSPEQVNLPLQNSEPFRKAFGCRTGTFMAPANTCRFWAS